MCLLALLSTKDDTLQLFCVCCHLLKMALLVMPITEDNTTHFVCACLRWYNATDFVCVLIMAISIEYRGKKFRYISFSFFLFMCTVVNN